MDTRRRRLLPSAPILDNTGPRNTLFPTQALVISLARSGRIQQFNQNNNFNGTTTVIDAVDGLLLGEPKVPSMKRGDVGCLLSHKKALELAKESGWDCVIVFEDDVTFPSDFNERLHQCMAELPENWDLFWGGGKDNTPAIPYSNNLKQLTGSWGTFMYVIRNTVYDYFIDVFSEEYQSSDEYFRRNHLKFNSFRASVDLVQHIHGPSDRITINQGI